MNIRQPVNPEITKITAITALYERLSREDELQNDSNSIINQKKLLEDYAKRNAFERPIHFTDDGVSGTRFDRPGFNRMMDEVASGNVATIIVKDMSRFGRDYLRVGLYMETLREQGVRLIAMNDGVDSANGDDDFIPFRNIINEWAARDSSRKTRAIFKAQALEGKHVSANVCYGYLRDPNEKGKWIIDEEAAPVVRRIYQMILEGKGVYQIADILGAEQIPIPGAHWKKLGIMNHRSRELSDPYFWSGTTIRNLLRHEEYMGHTVNFKSYKDSYKDKRRKITPKEDRMIFENTHEAIVDEETWHTVQRLIQTVRKPNKYGEINPLTGLLFCADCGRKMTNHRSIDTPVNGRYKNGGFADVYICANHRKHGKTVCTMHYIRTAVVQSLVLEAIQKASSFALDNEEEFIRRVREASAVQQEETVKANRKRLAKSKKRCDELDSLIKKLYENLVAGRLNEKRFDILSAEYEQEQSDLEQENIRLQLELEEYESDSVRADKFIETVKKYTSFNELTTTMINEFVEKIIVHESDRSSGEREQVVDIYLNFIGKFNVPEPEPTPEELAAAEAQRQLRNKRREYNQRYYEKKRRLEQENQTKTV